MMLAEVRKAASRVVASSVIAPCVCDLDGRQPVRFSEVSQICSPPWGVKEFQLSKIILADFRSSTDAHENASNAVYS
jgi:hypothetical protein